MNYFFVVFWVSTIWWAFQIQIPSALNCKSTVMFSKLSTKTLLIFFFVFFSFLSFFTFSNIANQSSRYWARFFLSYFSDDLWSRKLPTTSSHTFVPCKAPIATSNNYYHFLCTLSFFKQAWFSSVFDYSINVGWYANVLSPKLFSTEVLWLKYKILLNETGHICKRAFHQY